MKHLLLILALITLSALAFAQTGMFGLSYGQSMAAAISTLEAHGFEVTLKEADIVDLTNTGIKDLKRVRLNFYQHTLFSWDVIFDATNMSELKARITKDLEALHGKAQIWEGYNGERAWKLDNDNAVYIFEYSEDNELIVEYIYWVE